MTPGTVSGGNTLKEQQYKYRGIVHTVGNNVHTVNANAYMQEEQEDEEEDSVSVIIEETLADLDECMQQYKDGGVKEVFGPKPRCTANTKKGERCRKNVVYNGSLRTQFCRYHTPASGTEKCSM